MREWVEAARNGDPQAWGRLVRHFSGMALSVAYGKLHDWGLAEDAVQEAFAEAFLHLANLQEADAFPGWFKVIIERQCHRLLRRKQHATIPLEEAGAKDGGEDDVAAILERKEWQARLRQSVEGLPENLKVAVQLFYFQGYAIKEIASFLAVSPGTLKKRLFDARNKLRSELLVADFISMFNNLYEGEVAMLHIVNGDCVGDKLKTGNIRGDILVWREIYPIGPVFPDMAVEQRASLRAPYLEKTLGISADSYVAGCEAQEQQLRAFREYDEVVLWFEHDLFDQLMLSYLLHWFSRQALGRTKLNLLCIGDYPGIDVFRGLGQLTTRQLEGLSGTWQRIGQPQLEAGSKIWEAYASNDVERHAALLQEDTSALPFAHAALAMHLSRLPSAKNGLGIVEQTTIELIRQGANNPRKLFQAVGKQLHALGMGDLEFWHRLRSLAEQPHALLEITGAVDAPDSQVVLTPLGLAVAEGTQDWVALKGMDEWYGGLRLQGKLPWRWDGGRRQVVPRHGPGH